MSAGFHTTKPHRPRAQSLRAWSAACGGLVLVAALAGASAASDTLPGEAPDAAAPPSEARNPDPWEGMNRGLFKFNEWTDIWALKPIAQSWEFMTPPVLRTGVTNFNKNLQMPTILANNVLQLKPNHVGNDFVRFLFNSTFGIVGLFDISTALDIPQNDEDFGQTLGHWGVPSGPYFVIPLFGPSTVRGAIGRLGDTASTLYFSLLPFYTTLVIRGVEIVNLRSAYIEEIDENRRDSFDYYVFMRNAYLQNRAAKIRRAGESGDSGEASDGEDLYYFEDLEGALDGDLDDLEDLD